MPYWLFLKKRQNLKLSSAANYRWRLKGWVGFPPFSMFLWSLFRSLDKLICNNADYLMNSISLRLRHFQQNKKCPLVLKVMLQYSSAELLPLIDDTIQEVGSVRSSKLSFNLAMTCDFQQCGIFTCGDSDEPVQPPFKL